MLTALYVVTGLAVGWVLLASCGIALFGRAIEKHTLWKISAEDCIVLHIYALRRRDGKIPAKGKAAAEATVGWALHKDIPIIIPAGFASRQPRTDAVIYEEYMRSLLSETVRMRIKFIHGENPHVCTTHDEVIEAVRIMEAHGLRYPVAVGIRAHLMRIHKWWSRRAPGITPKFYGISCGIKNYPWEYINLFLEDILPPGTKRREKILAWSRRGPS